MRSDLHNRVLQAIGRHGMFRPGDRVGVAVSGGADSVALLRLLVDLRSELGIFLAVLHFNHQLRGAESDADEAFVAALAAQLGLEFVGGREDVAAAAREHRWNLEDAARRLRYAFFRSALGEAGGTARLARVAVAHSADDQAETVLARLVRGTGPAGLAAIYPVKDFVVRPLLEIRRSELREYLNQIGQSWREDASNRDVQRLRARLRHDVLPLLERSLQPALVPHLVRLAELAREDEAFWQFVVRQRLGAVLQKQDGRLGIRCSDLVASLAGSLPVRLSPPSLGPVRLPDPLANQDAAELSPASHTAGPETAGKAGREAQTALASRLVRGIVEEVRGEGGQLTALHVKQVLRLAGPGSSGRRLELPGAIAERSFDWIWFAETEKPGTRTAPHPSNSIAGDESSGSLRTNLGNAGFASEKGAFLHRVDLELAEKEILVAVPEIRRRFSLKVFDWTPLRSETRDLDVLDRDLLRSPLVLRNWQPGDSFQPQGRRHVHKLKHLLREKRVALRERRGWPVLISAGELVWTRGCPVAAPFAAGNKTRRGVAISEEEF